MKKIIIIAGPTGVGKSDFAELLAKETDGEIINADQCQLYEPLTIGTSKPDWKRKPMAHYLFDVVKEPRNYSNAEYQLAVKAQIHDTHARGKTALIVGGSGFYYQTLLFEFAQLPEPLATSPVSNYPRSYEHLQEVDPQRAALLHPHDRYRIERALDIYYQYNILPSAQQMTYNPFMPYILVHITRETQNLYERINERSHIMIKDGWLEEVAALPQEWKEFVMMKKPIGYDDILRYQEGRLSYQELIETIQKKTRNYAKRQKTFFRSLAKKIPLPEHAHIHELDLTLSTVDLYLNQLIGLIKT